VLAEGNLCSIKWAFGCCYNGLCYSACP
jgi:hypothetical protein